MHPPYYRGCWHGVSRCFLYGYRQIFFPIESGLHTKMLHPTRGVARSGFPPLPKLLDCCPPWGSCPYLSARDGGHALTPPTYRRLGEPLPHQLANRARAYPEAAEAFGLSSTCGISFAFTKLFPTSGQVPRYYYPGRHSTPRRFRVRLACLIHAASVHSEPGSNSPLEILYYMSWLIGLEASQPVQVRKYGCLSSCIELIRFSARRGHTMNNCVPQFDSREETHWSGSHPQ